MTIEELRQRNFATVAEVAAAFFGGMCDERTIRRGIEQGQIPAIKVGTKTLIPVPKLLALIEPAEARPSGPVGVAAESSTDTVAAIREILRGALLAVEALGGNHGAAVEGIDAGQEIGARGPNVPPRLLRGGGAGAA